jgi:CheY-like chemotaxis protein
LPRPFSASTVLVVEDDETLRMCAADVVADAGFTPVEAVNADEAVAILESRPDIALLFTDVQMPGSMDRLGLARTVHDRWPANKIILEEWNYRSAKDPPTAAFTKSRFR